MHKAHPYPIKSERIETKPHGGIGTSSPEAGRAAYDQPTSHVNLNLTFLAGPL